MDQIIQIICPTFVCISPFVAYILLKETGEETKND